jgi:hypothetical protein
MAIWYSGNYEASDEAREGAVKDLLIQNVRPIMPLIGVTMCCHCKVKRAYRPRGLCGRCYLTPAIRTLYSLPEEVLNKDVYRKGRDSHCNRKMPERTDAMPGTPEKVRVMMERLRNGEELFHPDDAHNE